MKVLITGVAGFIGMHVASALLARGDEVVGVDALTEPLDVALTYARLAKVQAHPRFQFHRLDIADRPAVHNCFEAGGFDQVIHLATQQGVAAAGARGGSRTHLAGFVNVLEGCRQHGVPHLLYASASELDCERRGNLTGRGRQGAGGSGGVPRRDGEQLAQAYSRLHGLDTTGLRFFTVYGPWGRPDLGYHDFTRALLASEPLSSVAGQREWGYGLTYVDDIVDGILRALRHEGPACGQARVLNIGSQDPVRLLDFIAALESALGSITELKVLPAHDRSGESDAVAVPGLNALVGEARTTMPLAEGVQRFVHWYLSYHGVDPARNTSALRRAAVFLDPLAIQWLPPRRVNASLPPPLARTQVLDGVRAL